MFVDTHKHIYVYVYNLGYKIHGANVMIMPLYLMYTLSESFSFLGSVI